MSNIYGALPLYQIHFFIRSNRMDDTLLARTRHSIISPKVYWEGEMFADELNSDKELMNLLEKVIREEGDIFVDPLPNGVRIYSKWRSQRSLKISADTLKVYNMIAKHIKRHIRM
ncbi:MAG: hypothetical protein QW416_01170 [Candidatus Nitrosocaldaceae archaeon]